MSEVLHRQSAVVGADATFFARLVSPSGTGQTIAEEGNALKVADVSAVAYAVYDTQGATPSTAVASGSPSVASVISDTLVADAAWKGVTDADINGRNFSHTIAGSVFTAAHVYHVVYTVTLSAGGVIKFAFIRGARSLSP